MSDQETPKPKLTEEEHERISRGERARMVLQDEFYIEAWEGVEGALIEGWLQTDAPQQEAREHAWRMVLSMRFVRNLLEKWMRDGRDQAMLAIERERQRGTAPRQPKGEVPIDAPIQRGPAHLDSEEPTPRAEGRGNFSS